MLELIAPTVRLHAAFLEARDDWGPGPHEDGFGLGPSDDVDSPAGFAAWVSALRQEADPAREEDDRRVTARWIVDGDRVLGGIALRHGYGGRVLRIGHIGYGVRPSARGRGVATWALGRVLEEARGFGMERLLLVCEDGNRASARTIERNGGVPEEADDAAWPSRVRRYWITFQKKERAVPDEDLPGCRFCDELRGRARGAPLAFEDERFAVFVGRYQPTGPGYALVVPRRHVQDLHDLPERDCGPMLQTVRRTSAAVQRAFDASGTTVLQNNGQPGQSVPHLHFHVVPRRHGDGYPRRADDPEPDAALADQARQLAAALSAPAPTP